MNLVKNNVKRFLAMMAAFVMIFAAILLSQKGE